jgi:hypothetical protein
VRNDESKYRLVLRGTAVFAFAWVVARAYYQAITMDEAVTYSNFVAPGGLGPWSPHANNHVLNSMLMRLFTSLFGLSPLTARAGALIGAAFYIAAAYRLCRLIATGFFIQWVVFVCLVFNPFVQDFLVAARGYGLASAFLMCAIAVITSFEMRWARSKNLPQAVTTGAAVSVFLALSFVANFSFALVDAAAVAMIYLWMCGWMPGATRPSWTAGEYVRIAAACVLPGLLLTMLLAGPVLVKFSKNELVYGAQSFGETLSSLYEASSFEVNSHLPRALQSTTNYFGPVLGIAGLLCVIRFGLMLHGRRLACDRDARGVRAIATAAAGILMLTVAAHWLASVMGHILWPKDRIGIHFVIIATLLLGVAAMAPVPTRWGRLSQHGLSATLFALALYFLLCLRLAYFKEWEFDEDIDKVYAILAHYNHSCAAKIVPVNWRYDASLNFYRTLSGREDLAIFQPELGTPFRSYPEREKAYILYSPEDQEFIDNHRLTVVFRSEIGTTVAIDTAFCAVAQVAGTPGRVLPAEP